jgi:hypothetical protein
MKRYLALFAALALCLALTLPVFAAEDVFVPSIGYKDGPTIEDTDLETDCLIVTSIRQAKEQTTDIHQEDRDLLLSVYKQLSESSMKLPLEDNTYVIRELVDVSFKKHDCQEQEEHGHKEWLTEQNTTVTVIFDLGVKATTDVIVLVYVNDEWVPAKEVENLCDGKVQVTFEDICPVAFCVDPDAEGEVPSTGDVDGQRLLLWVVLLVMSLVAIVVLVLNRRKFVR